MMRRALPLAAAITASWAQSGLAQDEAERVRLRPTMVTVTIENDRLYSGTYEARQISTICGKWTLGFPHRENAFTVEFPDEDPGLRARAVRFDADTLRAGTTTRSFYLAVGIRIGQSGTPPLYVVRANEPRFNEPGTAQLVKEPGGIDRLTVEGTAALGVKVRVAVVCQPRP